MPVALRKKVRLLREFNVVYLDDGNRIFKMTAPAFASLQEACMLEPQSMMSRYSHLLVHVRSMQESAKRWHDAEFK
jgi:hypothetical protein